MFAKNFSLVHTGFQPNLESVCATIFALAFELVTDILALERVKSQTHVHEQR
jgi:hypothetical protein